MNLAEKYNDKKIVVLAEETNKYAETLRRKGVKLLIGDLSDKNFLQRAKIKTASQVFAVIDNDDKKNVEIAQNISQISKRNVLECFTLINDRKLKTVLEESALFKYQTGNFDGILFNINEMGIKYGIATNIDKILPDKIETPPEILLVGLTEKTEIIFLNLAHCLTMKGKKFKFAVVEKDDSKVSEFKTKYAYLQNFADVDFVCEEIIKDRQFNCIFVCTENQTEAIIKAVEIRYILGKNEPNIIVFANDKETFEEVLKTELEQKKVVVINLFCQIADYVFDLEKHIEEQAKTAHYFWDKNKPYDEQSGHFKQTNRNQILDNYLRTYIALGEKMTVIKNRSILFSDNEKETLAIMEHRRWMLEKYENGWIFGVRVKPDEFKRHDCLIEWEKLPDGETQKDFNAIDLMIQLLNSQK
ncbi:hypothetical protein AGMMS50262_18220 [Bacteroidia bacterium]|nr:hypothetical protein AGMMS50262_18220 [Bacteroidia bacterium]